MSNFFDLWFEEATDGVKALGLLERSFKSSGQWRVTHSLAPSSMVRETEQERIISERLFGVPIVYSIQLQVVGEDFADAARFVARFTLEASKVCLGSLFVTEYGESLLFAKTCGGCNLYNAVGFWGPFADTLDFGCPVTVNNDRHTLR